MANWQIWFALGGLALMLSGCGGGGKKVNDSPAQLASQTVVGSWIEDVNYSMNSTAVAFSAQMTFHLDADDLNVRIDAETTPLKGLPVPATPQNFSIILDAGKKRATLHLDTQGALRIPPCVYRMLEGMPPVEVIKSLLKSQMENRKPDGMDGDFRQWVFKVPPQVAGESGQGWIDLDDANGLRKGYESVNISITNISVGALTSFTASEVTMGKPDAKLFEVPKEWGTCVAAPILTPAAMQQVPPPLRIVAAMLLGGKTLAPAQLVAGKAVMVV